MSFKTESGIATIGDIRWGSHFCQLYARETEPAQVLVPYFIAGLVNQERCIWITAATYGVERAAAELGAAFPEFRQRKAEGQISICGFEEWYLSPGPAGETTVQRWLSEERQALESGYRGLRVSGNTSFVERRTWDALMHYERRVQEILHERRVVALCTYDRTRVPPNREREIFEHHHFGIGRRQERWEILDRPPSS